MVSVDVKHHVYLLTASIFVGFPPRPLSHAHEKSQASKTVETTLSANRAQNSLAAAMREFGCSVITLTGRQAVPCCRSSVNVHVTMSTHTCAGVSWVLRPFCVDSEWARNRHPRHFRQQSRVCTSYPPCRQSGCLETLVLETLRKIRPVSGRLDGCSRV